MGHMSDELVERRRSFDLYLPDQQDDLARD